VKSCVKCDGPIPTPVLGDDPDERCPLCGDEPPSHEELAELLRLAFTPLMAFRDRALDIEGMADDDPLRDAALALDRAFDHLDSALLSLEQIEGPCRYCDDAGPHEGFCCEDCFDVLGDAGAWDLPLEEQRRMVAVDDGSER
jgi:hypothetical protein